MADDEPTRWHREPIRVQRTEVVGMGRPDRTERAERRHLVGIIVGQRRDGLSRAHHFGARSLFGIKWHVHPAKAMTNLDAGVRAARQHDHLRYP